MANKIPVKAIFSGSDVTSLGEYASGDTIAATYIDGLSGTNTGDQTITLTGEVTGSGTGSFAATVADNIIDEANLKVSNNPINGYVLTAQSGNTGGLTWEEVPTNYTLPTAGASTLGGVKVGTNLSIDGSGVLSSTDTTYTVGDGGLTTNDFTDSDHTKLDGIEASSNNYSLPTAGASTLGGVKVGTNLSIDVNGVLSASGGASYSVGDGGLTTNDFTDADHTKLDGIEASANNYAHPNHSGEVTSSADGATVIADNVVDEANLKVSNTPTDGYVLTAQSGNTGGLTWAEASSGSSGGGAFEQIGQGTLVSKYNYDLGNSGTGLTGGHNFIMGMDTANAGFTGFHNFAFGRYSMANVTGLIQHNFAFGRDTMRDAGGTTHDNFAFGDSALMNMSGTNGNNIAMGWMAQQKCTTGTYNIGLGPQAGKENQTAHYNVFLGSEAGRYATNGWNIGIGVGSGGGTGAAGIGGTTGTGNVSVGSYAARSLSSGTRNTSLGYYANQALQTGSGNTSIGQYSGTSSVVSSNQFTLGGTNITNLRCNDSSISSVSDERDKTDIQDTTLGLDFIKDVRPVEFTWDRRDGTMGSMKDVGFIAQELWDTELKHSTAHRTRMVQFDNPDRLEAAPNRMFPILVKAVQELAAKNEELETRLSALEG